MFECHLNIIFSYLMIIYTISSIYYLIMTKYKNIGTPFNDSLSPEQKLIKQEAVKVRKNIFIQGIIVGMIYCFICRPFLNCF